MNDPFAALGLAPGATADEVRAARRRLAKTHHPDTGGDAAAMRQLNDAAASALRLIGHGADRHRSDRTEDHADEDPGHHPGGPGADPSGRPPSQWSSDGTWHGSAHDIPSFTVEALPVETFEALLLATASIGEVVDDDPPYRLEVLLFDPMACFCRLELVPDAGASTVSITVGNVEDRPRPTVEQVRDLWIGELNRLDW